MTTRVGLVGLQLLAPGFRPRFLRLGVRPAGLRPLNPRFLSLGLHLIRTLAFFCNAFLGGICRCFQALPNAFIHLHLLRGLMN